MAYTGLQLVYGNARDEAHLPVRCILLDFLILEFSADEMFEAVIYTPPRIPCQSAQTVRICADSAQNYSESE